MGTEAFWVPLAIAAVSGGAQAVNQSDANKRAQNAQVQAIANQQMLRGQANDLVTKQIQNIAQSNPQQLAAKATGDYVAQLRRNAAGAASGTTSGSQTFGQSTSALPANVNGSSRYNTDVANSQKEVQQYGDTEAGQMGQIDAAVRQRQNEGLQMQTLGTGLNTLNAQSYGQSFVDQLRAQAAGQSNPWISLGASILGAAAQGASKNLGGGTTVSQNGVPTGSFAGMTQAGVPDVSGAGGFENLLTDSGNGVING